MTPFRLHRPATVAEAVALLRDLGPGAQALAGGTDLVVQMQRGRAAPAHVVSLGRLVPLGRVDGDDEVTVGALVTLRTIERDPAFRGARRALAEAARVVGGHQVRNLGTVGGNVCNASPAADTVPALLALDAAAELEGPAGRRRLPLDAFLLGPGQTAREPAEILTALRLSPLPARTGTAFLKAGRRRAMEISIVCLAARVTLAEDGATVVAARLAAGAVAPTALRLDDATAPLLGGPPEPPRLREVGRLAATRVAPIDDVRASAGYRRLLVEALVPRVLAVAAARAAEASRR